ncbi:hypothetical protein ACHAXR_006356 [Thalassiosira sp. AJA248-18]
MVSIEYSPNSRAHCQKCRGKINSRSVRVCAKGAPVSRSSGYINTYTHAECYTNRKDFTKFWGFRDLEKEDQKRFMTEEQKRQAFPGDYAAEAVAAAAATGLQKRNANAAGSAEEEQPSKKKSKSKSKKPTVLTIVGLKYADACAACGEKVTSVREPENQYDSNAIKVVNSSNRIVGRIKKEDAASLSQTLERIDAINAKLQSKGEQLITDGTILDAGNGYTQSVQVEFKKMAAKTKNLTPKAEGKMTAAVVSEAKSSTSK